MILSIDQGTTGTTALGARMLAGLATGVLDSPNALANINPPE